MRHPGVAVGPQRLEQLGLVPRAQVDVVLGDRVPLLRDVLGIRFNVDDSFLEPAALGGLVATPTRELAARDQLLAQKDEGMIR